MPSNNGNSNRTCQTCKHWARERTLPNQPIGTPHVGDCTETLWPTFAGVNQSGPQLMPGGYYNITFGGSYCTGKWQPRFSILSGLTSEDAEALPKAGELA
jgi:hypothetical protein